MKINHEFIDKGEPIEVKYGIVVEIFVNDVDNTTYKVNLICNVFQDAALNNYPFSINISLEGLFDCKNVNPDDIQNYIQFNAVAILFPYLRATISQITSLTNGESLNLPLVNVYNLIADAQKNMEFESIAQKEE